MAPRGVLLACRPAASKPEIPGTGTGTDLTCIVRCRTNGYRSGGRPRLRPRRRLSCRAVGRGPRGRCRRRRRSQSGELLRLERARRNRRASQPASTRRTAARRGRPRRFRACCAPGSRRPARAPADIRHARSRTRRVIRPLDTSGDRCASRYLAIRTACDYQALGVDCLLRRDERRFGQRPQPSVCDRNRRRRGARRLRPCVGLGEPDHPRPCCSPPGSA